jgi:hypothetical protein
MKLTLLQMTQNILSAMDSDEVNSINDTIESQQVAEIIKETYYDLFSDITIPMHTGIIQLVGLGDLNRATYMKLPTNVTSIDWVKYRNGSTEQYNDVFFLNEAQFFDRVLQNKATSDNVQLITDDSGVTFYVKNNQVPNNYTILNNEYLVMDSYDAAYDSTLQASKTFAWGETEEVWDASDDFIPNLENDLFPLLLSEAKSVSFITLKQTANQKEEQRSRRHRVHLQYRKWRDKRERQDNFNGPNYARNK